MRRMLFLNSCLPTATEILTIFQKKMHEIDRRFFQDDTAR